MARYEVEVSDDVDPRQVEMWLETFSKTIGNGEVMTVRIPPGFPMAAMAEVAARVHTMLAQYVELYAPKPEVAANGSAGSS